MCFPTWKKVRKLETSFLVFQMEEYCILIRSFSFFFFLYFSKRLKYSSFSEYTLCMCIFTNKKLLTLFTFIFFLFFQLKIKKHVHLLKTKMNFFIEKKLRNTSTLLLFKTKIKTIIYNKPGNILYLWYSN
jgi:hypothetical protein